MRWFGFRFNLNDCWRRKGLFVPLRSLGGVVEPPLMPRRLRSIQGGEGKAGLRNRGGGDVGMGIFVNRSGAAVMLYLWSTYFQRVWRLVG
jgi:hypothetical protein